MNAIRQASGIGLVLVVLAVCAGCAHGQATTPAPLASGQATASAEVAAFNRAMREATLHMNTDGILALWEDDGVSLLPGEKPLVGKPMIGAFITGAVASIAGAHMQSFEMACTGLEISADWASEICDEHQIVDLGGGKPPFDGRGKLLFVLHRGTDAKWRIRREMWNQGGKAE